VLLPLLLQLDPPELGQVRIDVRLHQQLLTLRIDAQTTAGQQALQSRLGDLRSALEQQGLQLGHVSVELRPATGPEHQFQDTHQQQGWGSHGESHPGGSQQSSSQNQSGAFGATNFSDLSGEASASELLNENNGYEVGLQRVDMVI
jgi:flagellar hook-length control protein FliK